jgi:hypothetical protein
MSTLRMNRRIGNRHRTSGLVVGWYVGGAAPRRHLFRRVPTRQTAEVRDLSASGASVVTDVRPAAAVGAQVALRLGPETAVAVVVRRAEIGPDGRTTYGVEFVDPNNALARRLAEELERLRPDARSFWESAR